MHRLVFFTPFGAIIISFVRLLIVLQSEILLKYFYFLYQVCCDGCNVWVHAECDKISSQLLKVLSILSSAYFLFFSISNSLKFLRGQRFTLFSDSGPGEY